MSGPTRPAAVLTVREIGAGDAAVALDVVREAFAARPVLDPPADASTESVASMAALLSHRGGLLALLDDQPVGVLAFDPVGRTTFLRRFGVVPGAQGHGIAQRLVEAAAAAAGADGAADLAVLAREELPTTVAFWERRGFAEVRRDPPYVELRRPLRTTTLSVPTADEMQALGRRVASRLAAGDLVVLTGGLGAGKTTFTQGLAVGLGVRGGVTSPTFVISRVHPSEVDGPALVHVDAYRLGGLAELDDLDLDTSLDDAVTVVEWGEGLAETLADSRLEVRIVRAEHGDDGEGGSGLDPRSVEITPVGPRWAETTSAWLA